MWKRLSDPTTVTVYRNEPLSSPAVARVLEALRHEAFADRVYAVTSLGVPRFTLAPDFTLGDAFAAVYVTRRASTFTVAYLPARSRQTDASRACADGDLQWVVELYLLRLLLEDPEA